jgi:hypothetical protein
MNRNVIAPIRLFPRARRASPKKSPVVVPGRKKLSVRKPTKSPKKSPKKSMRKSPKKSLKRSLKRLRKSPKKIRKSVRFVF